jgi:hypothetical protein
VFIAKNFPRGGLKAALEQLRRSTLFSFYLRAPDKSSEEGNTFSVHSRTLVLYNNLSHSLKLSALFTLYQYL